MSTYIHILLEVYCKYNWIENNKEPFPEFCERGVENPGYHCLNENCKFIAFTEAPFEIAYAGEKGEVPDGEAWMGFGGDMQPEDANENKINELRALWESVCREKIKEAYDEYMKQSGLPQYENNE